MAAFRVLLVEDEGIIRMMTAEFLEGEGFDVTEAWDGDEAARLLDGPDGFDILFTDVRMPGTLDGVDLAVHARRRYVTIPLLIVSGYSAHLSIRLRVLEPPVTFIDKPYDLEEIVTALRDLTTQP